MRLSGWTNCGDRIHARDNWRIEFSALHGWQLSRCYDGEWNNEGNFESAADAAEHATLSEQQP